MCDHRQITDEPESSHGDRTARCAADPTATGGHAMVVLAASYRVVTRSGRLSGGRACALSVRAAARNPVLRQERPK